MAQTADEDSNTDVLVRDAYVAMSSGQPASLPVYASLSFTLCCAVHTCSVVLPPVWSSRQIVIPLSALDAGIFYWIFAALSQTIRILTIRCSMPTTPPHML